VSEWPVYFGGAYLYKRSNRLWRFLIAHGLVQRAWGPLVSRAAARHRRLRRVAPPCAAGTADRVANREAAV